MWQMLMGGRSLEVSPDDYIFAATQIYLDIINIFLNILQARRPASSPPMPCGSRRPVQPATAQRPRCQN